MIEDLAERKEKLLPFIRKEYETDASGWWCASPISYHDAGKLYEQNARDWQQEPEIIIRKIKTKATSRVAFLLFFAAVFVTPTWVANGKPDPISLVFGTFLAYATFRESAHTYIEIFIGTNSIWFYGLDKPVPWQNVLLLYLKEHSSENTKECHLLLHYYNPCTDEFERKEISLEGLDLSPKEIVIQAEHRRRTVLMDHSGSIYTYS